MKALSSEKSHCFHANNYFLIFIMSIMHSKNHCEGDFPSTRCFLTSSLSLCLDPVPNTMDPLSIVVLA